MIRTITNPLFVVLLAICIGGGLLVLPKMSSKVATASNIVEQSHAVEKHGDIVLNARTTMNDCKNDKGMAEFHSESLNKWFYVCFIDTQGNIIIQILSGKIDDALSREITTIPSEHLSKPLAYLRNAIAKGSYKLVNTWNINKTPQWFMELILQ
jgi:hypothetical protein